MCTTLLGDVSDRRRDLLPAIEVNLDDSHGLAFGDAATVPVNWFRVEGFLKLLC
jgi:hypothetical protein